MDRLILQGLEFFGYHGVFEKEQSEGQLFIIDIELFLDLERAGKSDNLEATVNYGAVYENVKAIVTGPPCQLLEAVAERICIDIFEKYVPVQSIRVTIKKPDAPVAGAFDYFAVSIERSRPS